MRVHLVDGTYELFRGFYGAPQKARADGQEIAATRAVVNSMLVLLREATHVGIAFDTVIESFRNQLFADYKTGEGIDPALWSQFPLVEQACRALGLVTWSMVEFECDDALATMARRAAADERVQQVVICSPDKDLAQCVSGQRVVTLDRMRKKEFDEHAVTAKFGVPPKLVPDLLALTGDAADGVPGLKGFGAKSAAALLNHFGAIEQFPPPPWSVPVRGAETLAARFATERESALLYKRLTTLAVDVPLAESAQDLLWPGVRDPQALLTITEDERLVERALAVSKAHRALSAS